MSKNILVLPGDGIGQEIVAEAVKVLACLRDDFGLDVDMDEALVGGTAYDAVGTPLPQVTIDMARESDAVLLGAVGGTQWESLDYSVRPERGLLGLRKELGLFANLRPAILYPQLAGASTLRSEVVSGLDIMIVRELTGGIYFGEPRGVRELENGEKQGYNTLVYSESEVERIVRVAMDIAMKRGRRVCSVDKANVLEVTELWRNVAIRVGAQYPEVELSHMYVDNAAMQLVRAPKQFDVMVTTNMFGDILSDCAAMLTGSIGMLPSASLNDKGQGMYEPIHGSAPDIAGKGVANPLATILSVAMMLRYSLDEPEMAQRIEKAVETALDAGLRTADIMSGGMRQVGTEEMGDAIVAALRV
ncbi:MAG: 3-isopropylmalate dehydrogenase [Candidatus Sedimenticola endophacoides]|uniref:3-isopropylmalate dehydrogenase n=1 Tax=Candidatus Sedimenticola endophacoides TaxID=2548426 RepID=A0A657Q0S6_9GAMM|nr:MAG: 3-isopropylmalate dehydrogenase [Candidatus Sedimenticola endophacoides]OQX33107.1 MAG: 3-isopropylmalate dehydrogenase [Candidatus Sedimenticola endophacoides]OQX34864.1 MAG: 3-isopropylmalate dehydrogenase [Candidatus Sedimenticola endophacoides]OQX40248.1 MAG: 3-isopropylmalate dehydrogenase [Candidatus Sedimenticola endophacoides]OQX47821.1 MAG: 3-isopropylmalate dehydrogenase [Candidatus Sedimenticola endophacoides]